MKTIILPENFWCIANADTQVHMPGIIYCMGICITSTSNTKVVAHYADTAGFPSKSLSGNKHPLPFSLQANGQNSPFIFRFLLQQLKILKEDDIKDVCIFGNFKCQEGIFAATPGTGVSLQDAWGFLSRELDVSLDRVKLKSITHANYLVQANGCVMVIPDEFDKIGQIDFENFKYYQSQKGQPLPLTQIQLNFQFFKSEKQYSKDDSCLGSEKQYAKFGLLY